MHEYTEWKRSRRNKNSQKLFLYNGQNKAGNQQGYRTRQHLAIEAYWILNLTISACTLFSPACKVYIKRVPMVWHAAHCDF